MQAQPATRKRKIREEKRPACDACRKRKVRCDGSLNYNRPCTRCARNQIECVIPGERRMIVVETEEIPDLLHSMAVSEEAGHDGAFTRPILVPVIENHNNLNHPNGLLGSSVSSSSELQRSVASSNVSVHRPTPKTIPRGIGSFTVDSDTIDHCFSRFNTQCLDLIPVLLLPADPNAVYEELPLKFWIILTIGSIRYERNPELWAKLHPQVENLALTSLFVDEGRPSAKIEALLLMSFWHLSFRRPFFRSFYYTFTSAILDLTQQAGLHSCVCLQALYPDRPVPDQEIIRGLNLWACAVISHQSALSVTGLPPCDHSQSSHLLSNEECTKSIPDTVLLRARLMGVVTKGNRLITDIGIDEAGKSHDRTLKTLLMTLEAELNAEQRMSPLAGTLDRIHVSIALLRIRSLALFLIDCEASYFELAQAFNAAIDTIEQITKVHESRRMLQYCPSYVYEAVVLAACVLLKLLKSYPPTTFDTNEGTKSLLAGISLCSVHISLADDDVPARVAKMLSGLWSHNHAFQDNQGNYIQILQIRNRLVTSVVFDCLSRWRLLYRLDARTAADKERLNNGPHPVAESADNADSIGQMLDSEWFWTADNWDLGLSPNM